MGEASHPVDDAASEVAGALVPGTGPLAGWTSVRLRKEWQRLTSRALKAAEVISGRSREDLEELLEQDPALVPLYMRVLWAAGMNGHDETLRAMGTVLGEAVRASAAGEPDSVDDADQALMAMSGLTPRHFRVLRFLSSHPKATTKGHAGWNAENIAESMDLTPDRAAWCLEDLVGTGLVRSSGDFFGNTFFWATELGKAVVHASEVVGT